MYIVDWIGNMHVHLSAKLEQLSSTFEKIEHPSIHCGQ